MQTTTKKNSKFEKEAKSNENPILHHRIAFFSFTRCFLWTLRSIPYYFFFFIPVNSTFLRGVLFFIRFYFAWFIFSRVQTLHIFARTQFFALLYFSLGSYFRVSKMVLIFAGPKNRENKNTRSLKPRNGEPCEIFDVYSKASVGKKINLQTKADRFVQPSTSWYWK